MLGCCQSSLARRGTSQLGTVATQPHSTSAVSCGKSAHVCALCEDEVHVLLLFPALAAVWGNARALL